MKRRIVDLAAVVACRPFVLWIGSNTRLGETPIPMPPKGEAITNPFYAAQAGRGARRACRVGSRVHRARDRLRHRRFRLALGSEPRAARALERWVESGGRLVVDGSLVGGRTNSKRWSGIVPARPSSTNGPTTTSMTRPRKRSTKPRKPRPNDERARSSTSARAHGVRSARCGMRPRLLRSTRELAR